MKQHLVNGYTGKVKSQRSTRIGFPRDVISTLLRNGLVGIVVCAIQVGCGIKTTKLKEELMRPITFACNKIITTSAAEICSGIADVARWSEFKGYGFLPGILHAEYEKRTSDMIASRIRVRNTDGSGHVEEICEWDPSQKVIMKLHDFTPPLSRLATHFIEEWTFAAENSATLVTRKFQLYQKQSMTRPLLWLISLVLRRAVARHLTEMARQAKNFPANNL